MRFIQILLILILFSVQLFAQNLSKGFNYVTEHEYDKALKIFTKSINNGKDVVAGKYGAAVVLPERITNRQTKSEHIIICCL